MLDVKQFQQLGITEDGAINNTDYRKAPKFLYLKDMSDNEVIFWFKKCPDAELYFYQKDGNRGFRRLVMQSDFPGQQPHISGPGYENTVSLRWYLENVQVEWWKKFYPVLALC